MLKQSRPVCRVGGVVLLVALAGCGISKQYVGANARTIRESAEMTKKTLAECVAAGNCAAVLPNMNADLDQITERASAMCDAAAPECEGAPK
jgi:hypothetical protein